MRFLWYTLVNWIMSGVLAMFPFAIFLGASLTFGRVTEDHRDGFLLWAPFLVGSLAWGSGLWHRYVAPRLGITSVLSLGYASFGVALIHAHLCYAVVASADERGWHGFSQINYPGLVIFFGVGSLLFFWAGIANMKFGRWLYGQNVFWFDWFFLTREEIDHDLRKPAS
jgi:hypothetical protein